MKTIFAAIVLISSGMAWSESQMQVDFRWLMSNHCNNTSPELRLKSIPPGTTSLKIQMVDLDNHRHDHGGGLLTRPEAYPVEFKIEAGALDQYTGPCPENFTTLGHEYQFNVTAMNAQGQTLSIGSAKAPFSAKFVILQGVIGKP